MTAPAAGRAKVLSTFECLVQQAVDGMVQVGSSRR